MSKLREVLTIIDNGLYTVFNEIEDASDVELVSSILEEDIVAETIRTCPVLLYDILERIEKLPQRSQNTLRKSLDVSIDIELLERNIKMFKSWMEG